tara:strand:- start:7677 stop:8372 length:696 start_codon:yes stop_codon:yes gene_type:complete
MANAIAVPFGDVLPTELARMIIAHCFDVSCRRGADRPVYMRTDPLLTPIAAADERHSHALNCRAICKAFFVAGSVAWLGPPIPGSGLCYLREVVGTSKYVCGVATVLIDAVKSDRGRLTTAAYSELYHHAFHIHQLRRLNYQREFKCWEAFASDVPTIIRRARLTDAQHATLMRTLARVFSPMADACHVHARCRGAWASEDAGPAMPVTVADVVAFGLKEPLAVAILAINN